MKKTVTVNIGGIVFHIDDDAYDKLQAYLAAVNSHFSGGIEEREILSDIESRIAELFREKMTDAKQVITIQDVESVIKTMGQPEDFGQEKSSSDQKYNDEGKTFKTGKRIYRDSDNRILGGVCAGLGSYFAIDPLLFRILFVILALAFGSGFWIYILLWAIVPLAKTTAQKLEMRGERINISNIERTIKEEFEQVKDRFNKMRSSENIREAGSVFSKTAGFVGEILHLFFRFFLILFGVLLIITGVALMTGLTGTFLFDKWGIHDISLPSLFSLFIDPVNTRLALIGIALVAGIPLLALIYSGIVILFRIKINNRIIGVTSLILWIMGLMFLVFITLNESKNYRTPGRYVENIEVYDTPPDTLYIKTSTENPFISEEYALWEGDYVVVNKEDQLTIYGLPKISIEKSKNQKIEIILTAKARGTSKKEANRFAENISYQWETQDSVLIMDPYFSIPLTNKWRKQELNITVRAPKGTVIRLDENMEDLLHDMNNVRFIDDDASYHHKRKYYKHGGFMF